MAKPERAPIEHPEHAARRRRRQATGPTAHALGALASGLALVGFLAGSVLVPGLVTGCGPSRSTGTAPPQERPQASRAAGANLTTKAAPFETVRAASGCAFESAQALCEGFREHFLSASPGWVSDGCAQGERRTSNGAFAEVRVLGLRVGHEPSEETARVEQPLLSGSVRVPASAQGATTHLLLAARVGEAWFPIYTYQPPGDGIDGTRVEWALDASGDRLTFTSETGASRRDDPDGYGETERTIAVVQAGLPKIAARATIERWRSETDLACVRPCNQAPSPPPSSECSRRCASKVRQTRSWSVAAATVRIGATEVHREGREVPPTEVAVEPAQTSRLDTPDQWLDFCAFMRVVRAVAPSTLPTDPPSVAARERARSILRNGAFRELAGTSAVVEAGAARATIEIDGAGMTGCGGGGCTTEVRFRTIEGSMPEQGVSYFANDRGNQVGCDAASLPRDAVPTFVEVAPATSREAIGCGFAGYDGTRQRYWVILRVFVPAPLP